MTSNPWTDLSGGIRVRQSRVFWMNSVLFAHPDHSVLVDPGVLPSELDELVESWMLLDDEVRSPTGAV